MMDEDSSGIGSETRMGEMEELTKSGEEVKISKTTSSSETMSKEISSSSDAMTTRTTRTTTKVSSVTTKEVSDDKDSSNSTNNDEDDEEEKRRRLEVQKRLRRAMWRDTFFLILGGIALQIISYVETHAADANIRGWKNVTDEIYSSQTNGLQIVDAGFVITEPIQIYLSNHRSVNDFCAFLNSLLLVFPSIYVAKVTIWNGDYTASFRVLMTQLLRSFCGWLTYLPPDPSYLMSYYDFPDVAQCLFVDCSNKDPSQQQVLPFVSFFSGHVATVVIIANHMYVNGYVKSCVALHLLNVLQIIRLLATRGHYSIDIVIGWCVAVYVSQPAERLGRYYSRGVPLQSMLPNDAKSAFETVTGVRDVKRSQRYSILAEQSFVVRQQVKQQQQQQKQNGTVTGTITESSDDKGGIHTEQFTTTLAATGRPDLLSLGNMTRSSSYGTYEVVQSETTAKVVAEIAKEYVDKHQDQLKNDLHNMGLKMKQLQDLRRDDLMKLRALAELKFEQLREEAIRLRSNTTAAMTTGGMTTSSTTTDDNDDDDDSNGLSLAELLSSFIRPTQGALVMEQRSIE